MLEPETPSRMPVLFVGHGSPMNAIQDNVWSRGFRALAERLPRPKAIVAISAHWFVPGTLLTANERPETIHDFGGFPRELYEIEYPARGDEALARKIEQLVGEGRAVLSGNWGLDHGTWSVLLHMFPKADVPVIQLSVNSRMPAEGHLALGRALAPLREQGVLIMGSGNVTHNLRAAFTAMQTGDTATPDWAAQFDTDIAAAIEQRDGSYLTRALGNDAGRRSHPTPDHYLPLLYVVGAASGNDAVEFPITGFDLGSLSMRAALIGRADARPAEGLAGSR